MSTHFGEIDIGQIVDNEFKIKFILKILDWIVKNNSEINKPTEEQLNIWKTEALQEIQKKYPNSGIKYTE